jgi:ubiquinone/menaquinone biosynthesis C-methylase UbiE
MLTGADGSVEFFDTLEQTDWNRSLQRTLIHWLGPRETYDVLDAGCGAGRFATHLAQRSRTVVALDSSPLMVERAKRSAADYGLTNMQCVVGNIRALPFADGTFDLVTCLDVLFMFDDPADGLRELVRVAKPGGQVVILNPSDKMNPWSAQTYCEAHAFKDFQRDSFLAWSTAAARRRLYDEYTWAHMAEACGAKWKDSLSLMDGLVAVFRLVVEEPVGMIQGMDLPTGVAATDGAAVEAELSGEGPEAAERLVGAGDVGV